MILLNKPPQVIIKLDYLKMKLPTECRENITPKYNIVKELVEIKNEEESGSRHVWNVSNHEFKSWGWSKINQQTEQADRRQFTPFTNIRNEEKPSGKSSQNLNDSYITAFQNSASSSIVMRIQEEILNSEARTSTRGRYITKKQVMSK